MESLLVDIQEELMPLLGRLIREVTGKAPKQTVTTLRCSYPAFGRWISNCDFTLLMETLALRDSVFNMEFPDVRVPAEQRREFSNVLQAHSEACEYCRAKRDDDLAWKSSVDAAMVEDKDVVRKVLARTVGKS